jgi:EAL domain-containing protein (putative c-di-GMP-specific phosphodiesterase class I)
MKHEAADSPGSKALRRVLILDDDPSTLMTISRRLQAFGMEVIACRELEAAEAILDHDRMDAVITDLCVSPLGGLEGTRLVKHVATHFPETDLLVVSAYRSPSVKRLVLDLGAAAFFDKPADPAVLARQILRGRAPEAGAPRGLCHEVGMLDDYLAGSSISAVLQPIVSLREGPEAAPLFGLESLARGPRESVLRNPEILFEYAARKERLYETDLICIRAGLEEARKVGRGYRLFLNVQPRSLTKPEFTSKILGLVDSAGFAPSDVVFEVTEQQTILNPRAFAETLRGLRTRGFQVALDDFGVGFCNLNLLLDLRPDLVKLPRYFTSGIPSSPEKREAVRAIRTLAAGLGIPCVMEGVENAEELETVRDLGIDFAQGYHFSRPMAAEGIRASAWFAGHPADPVALVP